MTDARKATEAALGYEIARVRHGQDVTASDLANRLMPWFDKWQAAARTPQITDEMVERAARQMFESGLGEGDCTWGELIREDPSRAAIWRADARAAIDAALMPPTGPKEN